MADRAEGLFNELAEICERYKAEVPSNRGPWPESVKTRVFELKALGLSFIKIAKRTGIPYGSVTSSQRPAGFLPVKVVEEKSPTVTVGRPRRKKPETKFTTVTVITPSGYRIEGLDSRAVAEFISAVEPVFCPAYVAPGYRIASYSDFFTTVDRCLTVNCMCEPDGGARIARGF